jgi:hypothetical protein
MTPEQAAHELRESLVRPAARFMADAATLELGAKAGFEGFDFYVGGRGGALGDVPADVVVAAFVFFGPEHIRAAWERSERVMPRREAAALWAEAAHNWARTNLDDADAWNRLAELLDRVVHDAAVAGAPIFAGWRTLPEPEDAPARVAHHMNGLRELRGGLHGAAVLTVGLSPVEAISVLVPNLLPVLGWNEEPRPADPLKDRWQLAEARTDRMFGRHLAVLEPSEREELIELSKAFAK